MKRLRCSQWSGQLLQVRSGAVALPRTASFASTRYQSASAIRASLDEVAAVPDLERPEESRNPPQTQYSGPLPSPSPDRMLKSAKLAALHARLALSSKIPLQTLGRALICPSADQNPNFNNDNLAHLGSTLINFHVLEWLVCKYPRLPMSVLYEALRAYAGPESLSKLARRWGTEEVAAPGEEVDPGLLQWTPSKAGSDESRLGGDSGRIEGHRRGMSSRVVRDDDFGDVIGARTEGPVYNKLRDDAFASFSRAVVGSIYTHAGRSAARAFINSHILSRSLDMESLFSFEMPTKELTRLCQREGFEAPIARLESETGRLSRTPVFIVGVYSGKEKLAEAPGASLDIARKKAAMNALKAWYLYSPGNKVAVPSDMFEEGAKPWKAPHIDCGEVL